MPLPTNSTPVAAPICCTALEGPGADADKKIPNGGGGGGSGGPGACTSGRVDEFGPRPVVCAGCGACDSERQTPVCTLSDALLTVLTASHKMSTDAILKGSSCCRMFKCVI